MRTLHITREVDRKELVGAIKKESHPKRRTWFELVLFVLDGEKGKTVAKKFDLHPVTVSRAIHRFNEEGLEGMHCCCQGRRTRITKEAEVAVVKRIEQALRPIPGHQELVRGRDLQQMLEKEFGIQVHAMTIYRLLHRLGYTVLKPRPCHPKKKSEQTEIFKKGDVTQRST